jgi:ectoine hydroxylase-related dioxygenase (phytanoyl-CoA dioxygenase family)
MPALEQPMPAAAPALAFPHIDASLQDCISDEQAEFFRQHGLLVIRNVVRGEELARLQRETRPLVDRAVAGTDEVDWMYKEHELSGQRVPFRVEYVVDKVASCRVLAGHPFVLRSVEKLQGRNFIPTWDSMVFKNEGMGVAIPWHRDAGIEYTDPERPIFNVDFYLDRADLSNCLWGILGSNRWDQARVDRTIAELNQGIDREGGFRTDGALPITMEPGDVILHNITALHGSAPARTHLRRVLYFEYRPGEVERAKGPHVPGYVAKKQQVLLECLRQRAAAPYTAGETPFIYRPGAEFSDFPTGAPATFRYPHGEWWRKPGER